MSDIAQALQLYRSGDLAGAERVLARMLKAAPHDFNATHLMAGVKRAAGERGAALDLFDVAMVLDPKSAQAAFNRANLLAEMARFEDAARAYERALKLNPSHAEGWHNRGRALASLGRHEEALACFEASLRLKPDDSSTHDDRGVALYELGRRAEAMESLDRAVALAPGDAALSRTRARAEYNKSAVLAEGDLAEGFRYYERRREAGAINAPDLSRGERAWRGEALTGVLRVWPEMGVGEEVLFAGLLPLAQARAPHIAVECDARFVPLLQRSMPFLDVVRDGAGEPIENIEAQSALASLAHALGLRRGDIAPRPAYLKADPERVATIRARYEREAQGRPIVGIAWRSKNLAFGERKSAALGDWGALLTQPCLFVNLQYGDVAAEIAAAREAFGAAIVEDAEIDQMTDLDGFAAQIAACDRVVTISNTTAHMAGALGVSTLVLVPPERRLLWYWGVEGDERTIWYESVRLSGHDAGGWPAQAARAAAWVRA